MEMAPLPSTQPNLISSEVMESKPPKGIAIYVAVGAAIVAIALGGYFLFLRDGARQGEGPFIPSDPGEYYGYATHDSCQKDNQCVVEGCNQEICRGKEREAMVSICLVPDKPTPKSLGYQCRCLDSECQWTK
jgi:eight-cysteine-cluster-containing protein